MTLRTAVRLLGRLLRLEPREWADLIEAQWGLMRARAALRRRPLGSLVEPSDAATAPPNGSWRKQAQRVEDAIQRAAVHGLLRPTCLERAMALQRMLARRGIGPGSIRVGVRVEGGEFGAHAWVQLGEVVLGDHAERIAGFAPLTEVRTARS